MKTWSVLVTIPDALAHLAQQRVTVIASSWHVAAARGVQTIMARPGIRGKHHETIRVEIIPLGEERT
jgi:hypothetical protein